MNDNSSPENSAFSSQNALARIAGARAQASKDANRLFLASLIFIGLYLVKASGLRIDLTLLDTDIAKVPHGLFLFLIASQVSAILCFIRTSDASALDARLSSTIRSFGQSDVDQAAATFANEFEWFSASSREFENSNAGPIAKSIYGVTSLFTFPTWLALYLFPIACGIYTIVNCNTLIITGNITLQYWLVVITTTLSSLWFLNFVAIHSGIRSRKIA